MDQVKRIGIVEIGSRGVRLLVGVVEQSHLEVVARRYNSDVRLAEALKIRGVSLAERITKIREVVDGYIRLCQDAGVDELRVFGTESVRQLRRRSRTGFKLLATKLPGFKVLQRKEEAFYSLLAAYKSLPGLVAEDEALLVVDLGAGSVELALGKASGPSVCLVAHRSYLLGTEILVTRLRELDDDLRKMPEWIAEQLGERLLRGVRSAKHAVIMGSAATKLAWINLNPEPGERYDPRRVHGLKLRKQDVDECIRDSLQPGTTMRQRIDPRNPSSGEFETVVTGLMVIGLLLDKLRISEFRVCAEAMRLGVAWALAMNDEKALRPKRRVQR